MTDRQYIVAEKISTIFRQSLDQKESFSIVFSDRDANKSFFIHNRRVVHLDSSVVSEKFAALLVMTKLITRDDLKVLADQNLKSWELDNRTIATGLITSEQAAKISSLQLSRMIKSLLDWTTINFKIKDRELDGMEWLKPALTVEELLIHLYRIAPPPDSRAAIEDQFHQSLSLAPDQMDILKLLPLNQAETQILSGLNNHLTPGQILQLSSATRDQVLDTLAIFQELGFVAPSTGTGHPATFRDEAAAGNDTGNARVPDGSAEDPGNHLEHFSAMLERLEGENYYEIFEFTPEEFSSEQLKTRYHDFIRRYHPDKFKSQDSEELNQILEDILNRINAAYETLKNDEKRRSYDKNVYAAPITTPDPSGGGGSRRDDIQKEAKDNFLIAKRLIKEENYNDAIILLERSVRAYPDNDEFHAYLGYAMSRSPTLRRQAEKHYLRALELNPMNVNTHLHLALMYKEAQFYTKAVKAFREALKWDPENTIALRELQEIEGARTKKSKGFFGKLFGS